MNTRDNHTNRSTRRAPIALTALAGAAVAATAVIGLTVSPAQADGLSDNLFGDHGQPQTSMHEKHAAEGQVRATDDVNVRRAPSTKAARTGGVVQAGETVPSTCKLPGSGVDGTRTWYRLPGEGKEYVSGRYVKEIDKVADCKGGNDPNAVYITKRTWTFSGPNTSDHATLPALQPGTRMHVTCYLDADRVAGKTAWYLVDNDEWLPANGVDLDGSQPQYCS
ncbi:SH3 domain-containing protein [Microlunatus soli]|uniref:SH3b domain-containing protein n=1 Tax=Microlunatus soli TaxID=630515 RepID=A0A1H1SHG5_9ACTN|nr:SH3 domain-containing protein [Microlunatus soli]SDS46789.1 hypothetical protein SAMN04489812_1997 [Microlunatus soli]